MSTFIDQHHNLIDDEWTGTQYIEHYEDNTFRSDHLHKFWIGKIKVNHHLVSVGRPQDGDPQPGCPVDLAMFNTKHAAKTFAQQFLIKLRQRHEARLADIHVEDYDFEWVGAEHMAHHEHQPFTRDTFHEFWLPKIKVCNNIVGIGSAEEGDPQPDCSLDMAMFSTEQAAQAFARRFLDNLQQEDPRAI